LPTGPNNWICLDDTDAVAPWYYPLDGTTYKHGLKFAARVSDSVRYLYVKIYKLGLDQTTKISLQTDSGGYPSGTILGSQIVTVNNTTSAWYTIDLGSYIEITQDTIYHIVFEYSSGTTDADNNTRILGYSPGNLESRYPINLVEGSLNITFWNGSEWSTRDATPIFVIGNNIGNAYSNSVIGRVYGTRERGGLVKFATEQTLDYISFVALKGGTPGVDLKYKIYDNANSVVRSGTLVAEASVTATWAWYTADLSSQLVVPATTPYRFVIYADGGDASNYYDGLSYSLGSTGYVGFFTNLTYGGRNSVTCISNDGGSSWTDTTVYSDAVLDYGTTSISSSSSSI